MVEALVDRVEPLVDRGEPGLHGQLEPAEARIHRGREAVDPRVEPVPTSRTWSTEQAADDAQQDATMPSNVQFCAAFTVTSSSSYHQDGTGSDARHLPRWICGHESMCDDLREPASAHVRVAVVARRGRASP